MLSIDSVDAPLAAQAIARRPVSGLEKVDRVDL
jgi:hypothetical protein